MHNLEWNREGKLFYAEYVKKCLTPCAAQPDLHSRMQAALIFEEVRKVVVDTWRLERFPIGKLLQ